jgi:glc operon protein GlcG
MHIPTLLLAALLAEPAVTYLPHVQVEAAFAKGQPLLETSRYKVHASRREAAGQAEVHAKDTDIFYVLSGRATFVTGGTLQGGRHTGPDEVRGTGIENGHAVELQAGDVIVVPEGVPHWFKEVPGPFTYYVVKVPTL